MVTRNDASSLPALSHADALAANLSDFLLLFGRILMGWIFMRSGYGKIFDIAGYSATFPARGLAPMLAYISVPAEFFGGIALILGVATRYVTAIMVIFMLVATFSSHRYWEITEAPRRGIQDANFWKNAAMTGGLLFLFVTGPGKFSVDGWLRGKR